jgi:hypothetical protein
MRTQSLFISSTDVHSDVFQWIDVNDFQWQWTTFVFIQSNNFILAVSSLVLRMVPYRPSYFPPNHAISSHRTIFMDTVPMWSSTYRRFLGVRTKLLTIRSVLSIYPLWSSIDVDLCSYCFCMDMADKQSFNSLVHNLSLVHWSIADTFRVNDHCRCLFRFWTSTFLWFWFNIAFSIHLHDERNFICIITICWIASIFKNQRPSNICLVSVL